MCRVQRGLSGLLGLADWLIVQIALREADAMMGKENPPTTTPTHPLTWAFLRGEQPRICAVGGKDEVRGCQSHEA